MPPSGHRVPHGTGPGASTDPSGDGSDSRATDGGPAGGGDPPLATDGGRMVVPVSDRQTLQAELERFAGDAFRERSDGTLACDFAGVTHFTVLPDGRVDAGMPLHAFDGHADRFVFDHERGEVTVERDDDDVISYTFRRP